MKYTVNLPESTTARTMMANRAAERILRKNPRLDFISNIWASNPWRSIQCNLLPVRSVIEPVRYKSIDEVV